MISCFGLPKPHYCLAVSFLNRLTYSRRLLSRNSAIAKALREKLDQNPRGRSFDRGINVEQSRFKRRSSENSKSKFMSVSRASPARLVGRSSAPSAGGDRSRVSRKKSNSSDNQNSQTLISTPLTTAASTFVTGLQSVLATLKAGRRKLYKLYLEETQEEQEHAKSKSKTSQYKIIKERCEHLRVPLKHVSRHFIDSALAKHSRGISQEAIHDGVLLEASQLPQLPIRSIGPPEYNGGQFAISLKKQSVEDQIVNGTSNNLPYDNCNWRNPFLLWLHGVVDTRNVGALYRTALYFGVDAMILTSRATASLQAVTTKVSAGATEFMQTLVVDTPETFLKESQANGWKFYAAVAPSPRYERVALAEKTEATALSRNPCVVILGNENDGLPSSFVRMTDGTVSIQAYSKLAAEAGLDSLNVSVAGALLCDKFLRQPLVKTRQVGSFDSLNNRLF